MDIRIELVSLTEEEKLRLMELEAKNPLTIQESWEWGQLMIQDIAYNLKSREYDFQAIKVYPKTIDELLESMELTHLVL